MLQDFAWRHAGAMFRWSLSEGEKRTDVHRAHFKNGTARLSLKRSQAAKPPLDKQLCKTAIFERQTRKSLSAQEERTKTYVTCRAERL